MTDLKPCPCGKTPERLCVTGEWNGAKWQRVSGYCCGAWEVEFRSDYTTIGTPENTALAIEAWNEAPRGGE